MFNKLITVKMVRNFGVDIIYVTSEHRNHIQNLTGRKTLSQVDIQALKAMGFEFEVEKQNLTI